MIVRAKKFIGETVTSIPALVKIIAPGICVVLKTHPRIVYMALIASGTGILKKRHG